MKQTLPPASQVPCSQGCVHPTLQPALHPEFSLPLLSAPLKLSSPCFPLAIEIISLFLEQIKSLRGQINPFPTAPQHPFALLPPASTLPVCLI